MKKAAGRQRKHRLWGYCFHFYYLPGGLESGVSSWEGVKQKPALYSLLGKTSWENITAPNQHTHENRTSSIAVGVLCTLNDSKERELRTQS